MKRKIIYICITTVLFLPISVFAWGFFGTKSHIPYFIIMPLNSVAYLFAANLAGKHNNKKIDLEWFGATNVTTYRWCEKETLDQDEGTVIKPVDGHGVWIKCDND